jgi:hypothetical protein
LTRIFVAGVPDKDMAAMELGLAHSLSRYKLKFSPDKIDTMIVQVARVLIPPTFLRFNFANLYIQGPMLRPLVLTSFIVWIHLLI